MKYHEIIHPFEDGVNLVGMQDVNTCISQNALDTTSRGQALNRIVLDVDAAMPAYGKVFLAGQRMIGKFV